METTWPNVVAFSVLVLSLVLLFGVIETGEWPWK